MTYGALRLTGGNSSFGRLEINLGDSWGSVCADRFDVLDGHVACRQLGFKGVTRISTNSSWYVQAPAGTKESSNYSNKDMQISTATALITI